jgi:hypothetical protein
MFTTMFLAVFFNSPSAFSAACVSFACASADFSSPISAFA